MSFSGAPDDGSVNTRFPFEPSASGLGVAPTAPEDEASPVVDPSALRELESQLDSPAVAKGFARDYTRMWEQRYQSLASSLGSGDDAAALDAVLSLKTSSAMVGGVRLAELARELEDAIRIRDSDLARLLFREVEESGNDTMDELQRRHNLGDS